MAKYKIIPSTRTIVQSPISIGHKAEKGVEAIEFDVTAWVETYGSGTLTVIMRRWGDAIPYPIALEIDENNKATWTLSDIDTAKAGMAYAQLSYIVGETVVKKSDIYTFRVMDSLTGEGDPPEAYESWLEHLTHLAAEAMAEVLDIEGIVTDKTLTIDGGIADAKATGDALSALEDAVGDEISDIKADLDDNVNDLKSALSYANSRIIDVDNSVYAKSTNLANTTNVISGKVITIDGDTVDNASYKISDYFLMEPGEYTFANINYLAVYDLSKTFINRIELSNGYNYAVTEYRYIRIASNKNVNTWQINKGTTLLAYEPFYTINRLEDLEKDTNIIQPFIAGSNIYNRSSNLADTNNVTDGKVINASGEIVDNTAYHISDYLLLEPGDYVGKQVVYLAIYDLNKNFIERKNFGNNIITLNDYRYVRIVTNRSASTWQINKGVTLLDYEPFYAFNRVNAVDNKINSAFHKADYSLFKTDFTGWYKGLNENYADSTTMGFDTKYADVISMMDDLMAMSPNYVTKNALGTGSGTDSSNNPYTIYEYVFTPPVYTPPVTLTPIMYAGKHPKILIDACCQGDEKNSTFGWYYFLYDLVNNYDKNPALQAIRYGVEIHFLPVMCPWGFDNNSYTTENGVNLNRNFQVPDWAEEEHSGAAPFSEIDAQVARDWIIANTDALLYINTHTNGMWYASGYASMNANFMATGMNDEYFDKIFKAIGREIEHQTAMILQEHGNVIQPDSPEQLLGRIVPQPVAGNTHGYINHYAALYHNMVSITLETFNGLRDNNDNLVISTFAPISKKICSEIFGNHLIKYLEEYAKV